MNRKGFFFLLFGHYFLKLAVHNGLFNIWNIYSTMRRKLYISGSLCEVVSNYWIEFKSQKGKRGLFYYLWFRKNKLRIKKNFLVYDTNWTSCTLVWCSTNPSKKTISEGGMLSLETLLQNQWIKWNVLSCQTVITIRLSNWIKPAWSVSARRAAVQSWGCRWIKEI